MPSLDDDLRAWAEAQRAHQPSLGVEARMREIGTVTAIGDGIAAIAGLADARQDELLLVGADRIPAMAMTLDETEIGAALLGSSASLSAGNTVAGTGDVVRVPVGEGLLGRVVDPLGCPLDGGKAITAAAHWPVERPAPGIIDRAEIDRHLHTGILAVDAAIPIGRGQRELIIGDRKTGKTAIAVDAIISQAAGDVIAVYAAIGQKSSSVLRVADAIREKGPFGHTIIVAALADAPPGLIWLAPYAACAMAEYFAERGAHVLVVYDDLTKHAAVHRQISLLLKRPPGREAYPGDIFYLHSRLLERAARLSAARGGGSITALPIAETQGGNLSAYIPTNLISITDGQIYLEPKLFYEGQRPAVDVGLSVSRVGGKAQIPALNKVAESLRLDYAQFLELEIFTRFGGIADERTRRIVEHGRRIRALLVQPSLSPLSPSCQVAALSALHAGLLDPLPPQTVERFKAGLPAWLKASVPEVARRIDASGTLSEADGDALGKTLRDFIAGLAGG